MTDDKMATQSCACGFLTDPQKECTCTKRRARLNHLFRQVRCAKLTVLLLQLSRISTENSVCKLKGGAMKEEVKPSLANGTLVRHKITGYEGRIEGVTEIKACFTRKGLVSPTRLNESFQYR